MGCTGRVTDCQWVTWESEGSVNCSLEVWGSVNCSLEVQSPKRKRPCQITNTQCSCEGSRRQGCKIALRTLLRSSSKMTPLSSKSHRTKSMRPLQHANSSAVFPY